MLSLLRRRPERGSLLAVCPQAAGVATALVRKRPGQRPVLRFAEFLEAADAHARSAAFEQIAKRRGLPHVAATSAVNIGDYSLVLVDTPDVPPEELRAAVRWRVNELIDFHVDDAVIDVFDVPTASGERGNRMYAVAARMSLVKPLIDSLVAAGLALEFVDIPEFAIRNLAALLPEDDGGIASIYLEGDRGLITLTRRGTLYLSRRLDYGATRLFGGATAVTPDMEGRLDALVIEVQRSLDYYESHFSQPTVKGVVLSPLAEPVAGLPEYLQSQLGLPTRVLDLDEILDHEKPLTAELQTRCITAIGAALRQDEVIL
ncbi:MAG: hypothetical protein HY749_01460 [Gammaproteobacteria bacterium]|nr:hypothetical protein [Gammaproteobacteria bacterium]MBI5617868.1 hypothetical protein [Gammaproteobacteria bacterium]